MSNNTHKTEHGHTIIFNESGHKYVKDNQYVPGTSGVLDMMANDGLWNWKLFNQKKLIKQAMVSKKIPLDVIEDVMIEADSINQKIGKLREVEISIHALDLNEMEIPFNRPEKVINTVEASTRIDAIASAGFGLSRSKVIKQIKEGCLRLNWALNEQPSKSVNIGDLIHLEKKGSLKILNIDKTKKERWRIKLLRQ